MIPKETVDLILDTARIEDVISDFVALKRRGANFVACCPFHNEKTPSFHVSPAKGIYKCFGCGKAGSAVGFVMEHEHVSYVEALRYLATKYNIDIVEEEESPEQLALKQKQESLMQVMEFASRFYSEALSSQEGRAYGYAYFKSRGLEDETISRFGLGWAPSGRTGFYEAARAAGYKEDYLIEAGLCIRYDDGRVVDRFHNRAVFPIHSVSGRTIGFSCRTLGTDPEVAKYVNSPDTPLYDKSRSLYGIFLAKSAIAREDRCYLAEGNVDVVTMHQTGVQAVVASCGTSLTVQQIRLIKKFTSNITLMYDGDAAGIHAAHKAIGMILAEDMNVNLLMFPPGDDPDSFCRSHTLDEVREFLAGSQLDFVSYMKLTTPEATLRDPVRKTEVINQVADAISMIPDAVKREVFAEKCSFEFGVKEESIFRRINITRHKRNEERLKEEERSRRYADNGLPPRLEEETGTVPSPETTDFQNKTLAVAEADLLFFLLNHGSDPLVFPTDSIYYSPDRTVSVADFIRESLDADGTVFANTVYRKLYEEYMSLYEQGMTSVDITRRLLDLPDRAVAIAASEIGTEKYQLTVSMFQASLTTKSSYLVTAVPKALMYYAERRLQDKVESLRSSLQSMTPEEQTEAMRKIVSFQSLRREINSRIGRDKK